jgi:hypothetical protein
MAPYESVITGLITAFGLITIALINRTRVHAKATREQAENRHIDNPQKISNLRENIDHNQEVSIDKLDNLTGLVMGVVDTQRRQGNKLDRLFSVTNRHTDQIQEMTQPKRKTT